MKNFLFFWYYKLFWNVDKIRKMYVLWYYEIEGVQVTTENKRGGRNKSFKTKSGPSPIEMITIVRIPMWKFWN